MWVLTSMLAGLSLVFPFRPHRGWVGSGLGDADGRGSGGPGSIPGLVGGLGLGRLRGRGGFVVRCRSFCEQVESEEEADADDDGCDCGDHPRSGS